MQREETSARGGAMDVARQVVVIVALGATIFVNTLANMLPIGGRTTGEVSGAFPTLFTPAGYAFSIWGLIYLALIVYAVAQALPSRRANPDHRAVGWLFVGTCALNIGWLFAWHNLLIPLSLLLMLGLLILLILIYVRLDIGRRAVPRFDFFTLQLPFSLYLGWITVATVANVSIALQGAGWGRWGLPETVWAVIVIAVALVIGMTAVFRRRDAVFSLVLAWAFAAIAVGQSEYPVVVGTAIAASVLQVAGAVYALAAGRGSGT